VIAERLTAYLTESKGLPNDFAVEANTSLIQSGLIDSLGMEELVSFLESTFDIEILDDDLLPDNFDTIASITALIERKLAEAGKGS
jgi:acyl carrier protein